MVKVRQVSRGWPSAPSRCWQRLRAEERAHNDAAASRAILVIPTPDSAGRAGGATTNEPDHFCDGHGIGLVTVTGQILRTVHIRAGGRKGEGPWSGS